MDNDFSGDEVLKLVGKKGKVESLPVAMMSSKRKENTNFHQLKLAMSIQDQRWQGLNNPLLKSNTSGICLSS